MSEKQNRFHKPYATNSKAVYMRQWYTENRERINKVAGERRRKKYAENPEEREKVLRKCKVYRDMRREILAWLKDQPCMDCGNRFPAECMDFDHRDGTVKKYNVGNLKTMVPETIQAEVMKCDLVCSNCHRTRTRKRKAGEKWQRFH